MNAEYVIFQTSDGVELQGLLFTPTKKGLNKCVIHIHGLAGNFYENRFIIHLAERLNSEGIALFTFNNRGHDYISDLLRKNGAEWVNILGGGAHEIFSESLYDIEAAIDFIQARGVEEIILQGHSSGANKVVYFQAERADPSIQGLILLSPIDDIGVQLDALGDNFGSKLVEAQKLIDAGDANKLMPEGTFFSYPISAKTYLDYFGSDTLRDTFPYRNPTNPFKYLSKIQVRVYVLFGNNGEYVLGDIDDTLELLRKKAVNCPNMETGVVDGAPHNYLGKERELIELIVKWSLSRT